MYLFDHILVACLLLALPLRLLLASGTSGNQLPKYFSHEAKLALYYGNSILLWLLAGIVALSWWWYGRSWPELGFQWGDLPYSGAALSILLLFSVLYLLDIFLELDKDSHSRGWERSSKIDIPAPGSVGEVVGSKPENQELPAFLPATAKEYIHFTLLALTAGLTEEIVYRGYCISYLVWLFGVDTWWQTALVLFIPAIAFGAGHFYQGWRAVLKIVFMAVLFGSFFLQTQSLWVLMLVHSCIDLIGGMMGWTMLRPQQGLSLKN